MPRGVPGSCERASTCSDPPIGLRFHVLGALPGALADRLEFMSDVAWSAT